MYRKVIKNGRQIMKITLEEKVHLFSDKNLGVSLNPLSPILTILDITPLLFSTSISRKHDL